MYVRGLIPWNFAELAEAVPIVHNLVTIWSELSSLPATKATMELLSNNWIGIT